MGLLNIVRVSIGAVGVEPGKLCMLTTDDLPTITTAGYLNGVSNQPAALNISPLDVIECMYSYNQSTGAASFAVLVPSISNGVITLNAWESPGSQPLASAHIFVGNASNIAADVAMSGDATIDNTGAVTIADEAITLAKLADGIAPAYVVKFAAQHTSTANATNDIAVVGVLPSDLVFVQLVDPGTNTVSVVSAVTDTDEVSITFDADPGTDAIVNYQVLRAAS